MSAGDERAAMFLVDLTADELRRFALADRARALDIAENVSRDPAASADDRRVADELRRAIGDA